MSKWWRIGAGIAGALAYTIFDGYKISRRKANLNLAAGKRFVIVGGGFAGMAAAQELAAQLIQGSDPSVEILLVDQHDYLLFTPMLTEAVGARVEPHHIIVPLSSCSANVRVVTGVVQSIDLAARIVHFQNDSLPPLVADYLILCLGSTSNFHGIPGISEAAFTLKTIDDAYGIRQNAIAMVKSAASEPDAAKRQVYLTFVVAGGGYTGVEAMAALNELVLELVKTYPSLEGSQVQAILAEPLDRLMAEVTPDLASYTQAQLEKAGVRVLLKVGIKSVDGDEIEFTNGERIRAGTLIWSAGVEASPLMKAAGAPTGKSKGVKVEPTFAIPGFPNVWAVGDCAEIPDVSNGKNYAPTAQNASREGKLAARNVIRSIRGEPQQPFKYTPIGELALVGRQKGVARIYNVNFSGFIAYLLWRGVYIMKMPSMAQRLRVISDWCSEFVLGSAAEYQLKPVQKKPKLLQAD